MDRSRRPFSLFGALLIVATLLPVSATPVAAASATVPVGFADEAVYTGLNHPMAVAFGPDGKVYVAEKRGVIMVYDSLTDTTPSVFADLHTNVHNYWDRGLMGLAVDPRFLTGSPYVYVLYAYNHILGDPSPAPRWPAADALTPPGSVYDDRCTNPPAGTTDGCVISGRLSRLQSDRAANPKMTGPEHVLIEDWCQQFPSHSMGSLMFGSEGALYVSAGDGASFGTTAPDYGEFGGTLPNTTSPVTPENPCHDPGGTNPTPPTAEGGSLRSQDIRTTGDPTGLNGAILRVNPDTGAAWPTNANIGMADANAKRIIGYGLRNPYRFTINPTTGDVWIGDVGFSTWEEIDRLANPDGAAKNYGWPCYEGPAVLPFFGDVGLNLCTSLSPASVTAPYYAYQHSASVVSGDGCGVGSSAIAGMAFLPASSGYPASYDNGLFFTDYTRNCIWFMPAGSNGLPDVANRKLFANLARPAPDTDGGAVFLTTTPTGDLLYADYDLGEIRRIHYYGATVPPDASFTATAASSDYLTFDFDASGSSDSNGLGLSYRWDFDGDGVYDTAPSPSPSVSHAYAGPGTNVDVGLQVTNTASVVGTTTRTVSVGNAPPTVTITAPASSLTWSVGESIAFSATGSDPEDGPLPDSAFTWSIDMQHCPSDCHTHIITSVAGAKSGTVDGPDHEYPSHLLLRVTVTDSRGLTATDLVEIYPKTGTVAAVSSPTGIPIATSATIGLVGSKINATAPATATLGERIYAFDHWSDDLSTALTHPVPIVEGATSVTAVYTQTGYVDRADTCASSPAPVVPTGAWTFGSFGKADDVDWYRFKLTATTRVRLALGDLTTGGRLDLYSGCSTLLQTSDRSGNGAEEVIRSLPAGTYAVKLSGSGTGTTPQHAVLIRKMLNSVHVLSSTSHIEGSTLRLVGELYNNTPKAVGSVKVTAKLYNAANVLLATRTAYADLSYMPPASRAPFRIVGSLPSGYHHATFTVSAPATTRTIGAPIPTTTTNGPDGGGHWAIGGTVKNPYTGTVNTVWVAVTLYDSRGNILDASRAKVGTTTLGKGKSTTFSATFIPTGLTPNKVYVRGMLFR